MPHEIVSSDDEAIRGYVGKLVAKGNVQFFAHFDSSIVPR